jgi:2-polyprenyl-3-methyl-5-hydroxy-6-metoxy-1,4-benzoquinol methylase
MASERQLLELGSAIGSEGRRGSLPVQPGPSVDPGVREYFENTVERWSGIYNGRRFINWHLAHRRQLVIDTVRRLSNNKTVRVLDLGCGSGVLTRDLMHMGHSVVGLDCSEKMVRTLVGSLDPGLRSHLLGAEIGSAANVPFHSETFDVIICIGVIQYQREPRLVLREISRLLKPGGACVLTVPNQLSLHHILDPWCTLRYIYRLIVHSLRNGGGQTNYVQAALDRNGYTTDVYEKRYFKGQISDLVSALPLTIKETISFGYGPVTIANRPVVPEPTSIALSKMLVKLSHLRAFSWLSIFANRWVIVLEKQPSLLDCNVTSI